MAKPNPQYGVTLNFMDKSLEPTSVSIPAPDVVALDTVPAALLALVTSIATISDLEFTAYTQTARRNASHDISGGGQREIAVRVKYEDSVTYAPYTTTIGGLKPALISTLPVGSDYFDLSVAPWDDFVDKFEAAVTSEDGHAVHVYRIEFVGRNN